jgi:apolipoprotein N-acyltransferase
MSIFLQVFCAFFSSFITTLAIPNEFLYLGSPLLGLFALVPLYFALYSARSCLNAAAIAGIQIGVTHLLSSFWLAYFRDYAMFTLGASAMGTIVIGMTMGCFMWMPFSLKRGIDGAQKTGAAERALFFALVWTFYEWSKSYGFLGYPWGTLSMTAVTWNEIRQIASVTGERGVTFLFAFFSAVTAEGLLLLQGGAKIPLRLTECRQRRAMEWTRAALLCAAFFALALIYGAWSVHKKAEPQKTIRAALIQQNMDTWLASDAQSVSVSQRLTQEAAEQSRALTGMNPDVAIWSEGVLSYPLPQGFAYYSEPLTKNDQSLFDFIEGMGFPFVIGGAVTFNLEEKKFGNAVFLFDENGTYKDYYAKIHLVPFAEGLPFTDIPAIKKLLHSLLGFSDAWTAGNKLTIFEFPIRAKDGKSQTVKFSAPICFEDAFGDMCRALFLQGSEVFFNLTNDSWSRTASAEYQHHAVASYRAIELRTTLVRSTNSGYTAVIDPRGMVLADLPLFKEAWLFTEIPVYERVFTFYAAYGDVFMRVVMLLCVLFAVQTKRRSLF